MKSNSIGINRYFYRPEKESETQAPLIEKPKLAFVGACGGVGVTTLVHSFAKYLLNVTNSVPAVLEIGSHKRLSTGYPYNKIGIDIRFANRKYISYETVLKEDGSIKAINNFDAGINWCLRTPSEKDYNLSKFDRLNMLHAIRGDIVVCDIDFDLEKDKLSIPEFLSQCDAQILILDPLPSKLIASFEMIEIFKKIELTGKPTVYLINKMNEGVKKKDVRRFINSKSIVEMPFIDAKTIYRCEFECGILLDYKNIAKEMEAVFAKVLELIRSIL